MYSMSMVPPLHVMKWNLPRVRNGVVVSTSEYHPRGPGSNPGHGKKKDPSPSTINFDNADHNEKIKIESLKKSCNSPVQLLISVIM